MPGAVVGELGIPAQGQHHDEADRERCGDGGFQSDTDSRIDRHHLLDGAVKPEGDRKNKSDRRDAACRDGQYRDARGGDEHRGQLSPVQSLAEEHHPDQNSHKRVDEVAECGVDDVAVADGPDVDKPVHTNEH